MSLVFANPLAAWLLGLASVVLFFALIGALANDDSRESVIVPIVVAALFFGSVFGTAWSGTHRVVEPNTVAILVDRTTGQALGTTYSAGVISKPWTSYMFKYPSNTGYQWCPTFAPSVKGGAEVATIFCFSVDASTVNWSRQYLKYNGNVEIVLQGWTSEIVQTAVAKQVSQYELSELTNRRADVENGLLKVVNEWALTQGFQFTSVALTNWYPTSPELKAAFDAAQISVAAIDKANNEKRAAEIQAQTASIRKDSCANAGFTDQNICLQFLQLQWLQNLGQLPANFILSLGGPTTPAVAIPSAGGQ